MPEGTGKWSVWGYDTFEGGNTWYPVAGYTKEEEEELHYDIEYDTEKEALERARALLDELEIIQPSGQPSLGSQGFQDMVFIQRPDGSRYRVFPVTHD